MKRPKEINSLSMPSKIVINVLFIIFCIMCIVPFVFIVSASFSCEDDLAKYGFTLLPKTFTIDSYKMLFQSSSGLLRSYCITIFVTSVGTTANLIICLLASYALTCNLKYKSQVSFYFYFTMLFSGGMVPWYLVCTQLLHIQDTIWALIIPSMVSTWNIFMLRTFIATSVPKSIIEAVRIDGGSEARILFQFVVPIAKSGIATICLFVALNYWNDWYNSMMLINRANIVSLQYYMQKVIMSVQLLSEYSQRGMGVVSLESVKMPEESLRMAICVVTILPVIIATPYFQKYIVHGVTVGAVKG